ncbi:hypothetical protein LV89_01243 [Arcicella aurantiaca]|uniref:Uncharacterized protein n=1 Tax=Arcicella aurantiaca TaxID=591202 RepID=A0A316EE02_9BACT|nr:hypothetical protein [Arcicella aurantiaca]PWK27836.1 hypothetical protein LV89_01243 [Arcicella aurantiaca]
MSNYSENLEKIESLVTRNQANIQTINQTTFWIADEKQIDGSNQIKIQNSSTLNWLKVSQNQGENCSIFPVDGIQGVFQSTGLPVKNTNQFIFEWKNEHGIENKTPGDCDCLIVSDKLHFLEFKADATSQTIQQIDNNRNKAEAQLAKTLCSFREQLNDDNLKSICVLVVPKFFSYPNFKASSSRKIKFLKLYKCELKEITTDGNSEHQL